MTVSQLKKTTFLILSGFIILGLVLILNNLQSAKNVKSYSSISESGVQVIEVFAKNGYSPSIIEAKSNVATILRIKTENTYDCSAVLSIPKLNYSKFLPSSGKSDVQILPQQPGTEIVASCSMGMYGFKIDFV